MLSDLTFQRIYRTRSNDVVHEFFEPALKESIYYDRASGFFSVEGLLEIAQGLVPFARNGGVLRLVTSVNLSEESKKIIKAGYELKEENIKSDLELALKDLLLDSIDLANMDLIVNLIACDRVKIQVAYMPDALYHEKFGIFRDYFGDAVYFSGSSNATSNGHNFNRESFAVLTSWSDGLSDIEKESAYFESLWENREQGIRVMELPEACRESLIQTYKKSDSIDDAIFKVESLISEQKKGSKRLYDYQKEAIEQFLFNNGNHFFQMATGTGKTFTAIKSIQAAEQRFGSLLCLIVVPQTDLQEQWRCELEEQGIKYKLCGGLAVKDARTVLDECIIDYYNNNQSIVVIALFPTFFDKLVSEFSSLGDIKKFLIIDEAHSLSGNQISKLPDFQYRLGLSATPERFSEEETNSIINYFTRGNISTYIYDIDQAISNGFLSRYYYHPLIVEIDDVSFEKFARATRKIIYLMNQDPADLQQLNDARTARSLILKKAPSKLTKLSMLVADTNYDFTNSVVYCGAGKDPETDESIINRVLEILAKSGSYTVSSFTSKSQDRVEILKEFERGFFDTLVAIKCFDQGVDVPKLDKIYIMASDSSRRQTIQRRGRVLRKCADTNKEFAHIYDMLIVPPSNNKDDAIARSLMTIELARAEEYGSLAENNKEVQDLIDEMKNTYNVQETDFDENTL